MTIININDDIHKEIGEYVKKNNVDYPSIKNYVDRKLKESLKKNK